MILQFSTTADIISGEITTLGRQNVTSNSIKGGRTEVSDKTFEWSLTGLTILVIAWIVLGIVLSLLPAAAVVIIGIIVEIGLGGYLLHVWGKSYMERTGGM